jgi:phosphate/sulfate permease
LVLNKCIVYVCVRAHKKTVLLLLLQTVTAILFQKSWSTWMEKCQEVDPLMATIYYFAAVIIGSFCLLNLTVATVGQNYTRIKKEAEIKKAQKVLHA